jgi:hypothetical protein
VNRFSAATYTMLSAMPASTTTGLSVTTSRAARDSVMLWAAVNAVTILTIVSVEPPVSSRPSRKAMWS